jgi:hypothetical protein
VFEAALQQGLVWKHDADWAVFNSGLGRGGDASNPQMVFLQRRDWQLKVGAGVVKPWVASSKVRFWLITLSVGHFVSRLLCYFGLLVKL